MNEIPDGKLQSRKIAAVKLRRGRPNYCLRKSITTASRDHLYGESPVRTTCDNHKTPQASPPYNNAGNTLSKSPETNARGKLPKPAAFSLPVIPYMLLVKSVRQGRISPLLVILIPRNRKLSTVDIVIPPNTTYFLFFPMTNTLHSAVFTLRPS